MNKEETIQKMDLIRFRLRNIGSDIIFVGKNSEHVYQAKCERYSRKIDEIIHNLLEDEFNDVRS